jgi:hypothetical protein
VAATWVALAIAQATIDQADGAQQGGRSAVESPFFSGSCFGAGSKDASVLSVLLFLQQKGV